MKEEIKGLRVQIDGLAQLTKELKPIRLYMSNGINTVDAEQDSASNTSQIEKAVDSLYLAKAWLGKLLGELGTENPYGSGYKTKEDIVPTQDVNELIKTIGVTGAFCESMKVSSCTHIERVDWLRQEIEKVNIEFHKFPEPLAKSRQGYNVYTHLCEARFWLGFEMERLKNENQL